MESTRKKLFVSLFFFDLITNRTISFEKFQVFELNKLSKHVIHNRQDFCLSEFLIVRTNGVIMLFHLNLIYSVFMEPHSSK